MSSKLKRAIETALNVFNDGEKRQTLHVVPYIGELRRTFGKITGLDRANIPSSKEDLEKYLNMIKVNYNIDIDTSLINQYEDEDTPNYERFIHIILPTLLKNYKGPLEGNINIGIVSHSLFIMDNIATTTKKSINKYNNTETWVEKMNISLIDGVYKFTRVNPDECKNMSDDLICPIYNGSKVPSDVDTTRCAYHGKYLFNKEQPSCTNELCQNTTNISEQGKSILPNESKNIEPTQIEQTSKNNTDTITQPLLQGGNIYYSQYLIYKRKYNKTK